MNTTQKIKLFISPGLLNEVLICIYRALLFTLYTDIVDDIVGDRHQTGSGVWTALAEH